MIKHPALQVGVKFNNADTDYSGNANNVAVSDAVYASGRFSRSLAFNSVDYGTITDNATLDFSTGNFTISVWVYSTEANGTLKGILDKYVINDRKGFAIMLEPYFEFLIDDSYPGDQWEIVATDIGDGDGIESLAIYNNKLYGGTSGNGSLYEWNDLNGWTLKAPKLGSVTSIYDLTVYNNKLYGAGRYGVNPGSGLLYEWNDVDAWVQKAPDYGIRALAVYDSALYAGTMGYTVPGTIGGRLLRWNDVDDWVIVAPRYSTEYFITSLAVYNDELYGITGYTSGGGGGRLLKWNGVDAWVSVAPKYSSAGYIKGLIVYNNKLYCGVYTNTPFLLLEWNGVDAWVLKASEVSNNIEDLEVYNNKLYATGNSAILQEWNDVDAFTECAPYLEVSTPINVLRTYKNRLYAGTDNDSKLYRWQSGLRVSDDTYRRYAWTHICAVKNETNIKIYINSVLKGTSIDFPQSFDVSTAIDLTLAKDWRGTFQGSIDDIHIFNKAFDAADVRRLMLGLHPLG